MKTYPFRFLALWFLLATAGLHAALPPSAPSAKELAQGYREHRILAKPRAAVRQAAEDAEAREGIRVHRAFARMGNLRVLDLPSTESADDAIARLRASGRYEYVERDQLLKPSKTPLDPSFSQQWGLNNTGASGGVAGADIRALTAWDTLTDAPNVIVAIVDSGMRLTHEDLSGNLWANGSGVHGIDATVDTNSAAYNDPTDVLGHGTHVAGIIGAVGNNGRGISGVTWKTQLMPLKFLVTEDGGFLSDEIECINYAIANGASVINASFGGSSYTSAGYDAIKAARDTGNGIIVVAAAGNGTDNDGVPVNNDTSAEYPSNYALDNIVSVAAITRADVLADFSNYGAGMVELAAPGSEIRSTWFTSDTDYAEAQGTSMAAPHVTGAIALLRAKYPSENYRQIINRLLRATTKTSALNGKVQTGGRLNLALAVNSGATDNRPFNDDFADRAVLSGANVVVRSNNIGATFETAGGETAHAGVTGGKSLWWSWTAPATTQVAFETTGTAYTAALAVYTGNALGALTSVGSTTADRLVINATGGTTYQIAMDGSGGATGYTTLRVGAVPVNDNFASATTVTGESVSVEATLLSSSKESGEPNPTTVALGHSVWYKWTAPSSGHYILSAFATAIDTVAAVYTGSSVNALTAIASNDDASSTNTDALVPFNANAGTTYYFQIDHAGSAQTPPGDFTLTLTQAAWEFPADDEITSSPAVGSDGTIYFGAGSTKGLDNRVYALTSAGVRKWRVSTGGDGVIGGSPAIAADGTIYVGADNKLLYALNPSDGGTKWTFTSGTAISSTPAIAADGTVYFRDNTKLYALDPANGSQKWSVNLTGSTDGTYCSPVIATDGTIYVGTNGGKFYAVTAAGGVKWTFTADGDIYTSAAVAADGTVYFATLNGTLYALTDGPASATQKWSWTAAGNSSITSSIAIGSDGSLYFAGYDHKLYALSSTGTQKWAYTLGDEVRASSPAVAADGTIYIPCYDGLIYAVSANGVLQHTYATARTVRSSPAIGGNRVYVGSADGKLYAFDIGQNAAGSAWPMFHFNAAHTGRAVPNTISITTQPQSTTIAPGAVVSLSISASGSGSLTYQWFKDGAIIAGATNASYTIASVTAADAGSYTVQVTDASNTLTSAAALVSVIIPGGSRIVNLSARGHVGTGDDILIAGFVLGGSPAKNILVRGIGPGLIPQGVPAASALADPEIELRRAISSGSEFFASNNDWGNDADVIAASARLGAFALAASSKDAAIVTEPVLSNSGYTVQIRGVSGGTGIALAELYDTNTLAGARLVNISARCRVGTGDDVLIAGFVIAGDGPRQVLIRGIGPSLIPQGIPTASALLDPKIDLYRIVNGVSSVVTSNDDWGGGTALSNAFNATGAFTLPTSSKDAALLITLAPGVYTAQVSGVGNTTGIALVEVYEVP